MKIKKVTATIVREKNVGDELELTNWYEWPGALDGFENNPAFIEKMAIDDGDEELTKKEKSTNRRSKKKNECSWVKKRNYKKKMVRRFLSVNPDRVYSKDDGDSYYVAYVLNVASWYDEEFYDPKEHYSFNPYSHVYLSPRGDIRKWNGKISGTLTCFLLDTSVKWARDITNRRIRHAPIGEESNYSYSWYKKMFSPLGRNYY